MFLGWKLKQRNLQYMRIAIRSKKPAFCSIMIISLFIKYAKSEQRYRCSDLRDSLTVIFEFLLNPIGSFYSVAA